MLTAIFIGLLVAAVGQAAWVESRRLDDTVGVVLIFCILLAFFFYGAFRG